MTSLQPTSEYRFGGYRLDAVARKLFGPDGEPVHLSSRAFDTLLELIRHAGETLSKDYLMQAVWPDVIVEQNNLNQAISSLRRCLADSPSAPRFIQTIPGRGYRFIAPIEDAPSRDTAADAGATEASDTFDSRPSRESSPRPIRLPLPRVWHALAIVLLLALGAAVVVERDPAARRPQADAARVLDAPLPSSLAILPLTELNAPTDDGLFAAGLHDEMIQQLARIKSLKVISRENVLGLAQRGLPLDEIARRLRAQTVLTGTIQYLGERATVRLHMLTPSSGIVLWASSYEVDIGKIDDLLAIQSDIATNVAAALEAEITAGEQHDIGTLPTRSFDAYRYLLAAKNAYYFQDYAQTWHLTRLAIGLDDEFIDAHYYFSYVNVVLTAVPLEGMTAEDHLRLALASAERIIELAPHDSRGYSLRGAALATRGDWEGVTREVKRLEAMGVPLADMKFYAPVLMSLGNFGGAIEILEANLMTEPVNLYGRGFLMAAYEMAGQPERARREYLLGEELNPIWWGDTVNVFLALGRNEPLRDIDQLPIPETLKSLLANLDDRDRILRALREFRAHPRKMSAESVYYAAIAAHVGEHELAVELMREGLENVWLSFHWLWLPVFDDIRRLPSFVQLLIDSGIVDHWDRHGWPTVCRREGHNVRCDWRAYDVDVLAGTVLDRPRVDR